MEDRGIGVPLPEHTRRGDGLPRLWYATLFLRKGEGRRAVMEGNVSSTFKYRLHSPLAGLAADLTAEYALPGAGDEFFLRVDRHVSLSLPQGVSWRDAAWLSFGLAVHAPDLALRNPQGTYVRVTAVEFPLAHFRSEVAALAMDGWVRQEFSLPDRGLRAVFDVERRSYGFHWGEHAEPFSDDLLK